MKTHWNHRRFLRATLAIAIAFAAPSGLLRAQDDESVEGLYRKAVEQNMSGDPVAASQTFEKLFESLRDEEILFEDYGAQAGGIFFDYGLTLLPQQRWEDAKEAFQTCVNAKEIADRVESPIDSQNQRKDLAKFQLGFCEAQLGNHERAIELYDEYVASEPPREELLRVFADFKLRYGAALIRVGRIDEGIASLQEMFDNREARDINPRYLVQALLEFGVGMAEQATDGDESTEVIAAKSHAFLDKNEEAISLSPLDQYRFGFTDRLRMLGLESSKAGVHDVALRYFAFVPTMENIKEDINLSLARLPVGAGVPSQYQALLDRIAEREQAAVHPDAETQRLIAACYERMGNIRASRVIHWNIAIQYPEVPEQVQAEIFHEAARLSSSLGDFSAAQYFGEAFNENLPEDHPLANNVSTFMLQSLFTSGQYDKVMSISERVRDRYELGDPKRELADSLYPLALYTTEQHERADEPFDEYMQTYEEGGNREIVMFHRASNSLILGNMREAAEQYSDFLEAYPESERFLDNAFADLAIARFNLEDYPAAIGAAESLVEARPDSAQVGRTLNIAGDAYSFMAASLGQGDESDEQREEWEQAAIDSYLDAFEAARKSESADANREEYHKTVASEALWKAADLYYQRGEIEKGLARYDMFFPDYAGTPWEPQISVFSLEHLEEAGRGEEGLEQVEKMVLLLGNKPPEQQDTQLLRQAIGSYADASVRIRGVDETFATLGDFPGADPENQALLTWLKIQQVIVMQQAQKNMEKDTPEYAAAEARIEEVFESLRLFDKRNLSPFALREIGRYFAGTDNPFRAVPYFEELLARTDPAADEFKGLAEMELGKIEMRSADPGKVQSARERFRRIIDRYDNPALVPDAHLNLAKLYILQEDWREALAELRVINKDKDMFKSDKVKRAESAFLMGTVFDAMDDPLNANRSYLAVVSAFGAFPDWVTQAWERYIANSAEDIAAMPEGAPEEALKKRERELAVYKLTRKYLYQWQEWTDEDAPSGALRRLRRDIDTMKNEMGITPEEEQRVLFELGLTGEQQ